MNKELIIRVLIAKWDLESHDRGARLLAKMLSDAGMEVIYVIFNEVHEVADTAIQEDVDVIGLSMLQGESHKIFIPELMEFLKAKGGEGILVLAGGRIPDEDIPGLLKLGVARVFGPGSLREEIMSFIKEKVASRREL